MPRRPSEPILPHSEQAFLAAYDASKFPRPSVTVDLVLLTVENESLRALLLKRLEHPDRDRWALPGGFVGYDEPVDVAAARVLRDKVGLEGIFVEQLFTFGDPARDPRMRVISVAHFALVSPMTLRRAIDTSRSNTMSLATIRIPWIGEADGPVHAIDSNGTELPLAFDHAHILGKAVARLRGRLNYSPIAFELVGEEFTLRSLQQVHEAILGHPVNKDAFRRRILASGQTSPTGKYQSSVQHRPAELYRFVRQSHTSDHT